MLLFMLHVYIGLIRHPQQTLVDGKLVTKETTKQLKKLLFGSSKGYFNAEWVGQNFVFSTTPGLEYGLVQHKVSCLDTESVDTHNLQYHIYYMHTLQHVYTKFLCHVIRMHVYVYIHDVFV